MSNSIEVAIGVVDGQVIAQWKDPTREILFDEMRELVNRLYDIGDMSPEWRFLMDGITTIETAQTPPCPQCGTAMVEVTEIGHGAPWFMCPVCAYNHNGLQASA